MWLPLVDVDVVFIGVDVELELEAELDAVVVVTVVDECSLIGMRGTRVFAMRRSITHRYSCCK